MPNEAKNKFLSLKQKLVLSHPELSELIHGCTNEEIKDMRLSQNVRRLPSVYVEFMLQMGQNGGPIFENRGYYAYPQVKDFKKETLDFLRFWNQRNSTNFSLNEQDYVFFTADKAVFYYFSTILEDDPPIYCFWENDGIEHRNMSEKLSTFLYHQIEKFI